MLMFMLIKLLYHQNDFNIFLTPAKFNKYTYLTGCSKGKRPSVIADSTPLLHLLSFSMGGEQGRDLLFCALTDIVSPTDAPKTYFQIDSLVY